MTTKNQNPEAETPLLFISHRHSDARVANVLRSWVENRALGNVTVFQSSSVGVAPRIGANLNSQLMNNLALAQSVVLVYTASDQNWSYCMWECGVALDPKKPDTKIIVFQCGESVPAPFQDRVRVNVRDKESVQNFASDFLTKPDFFPRLGAAVAPKLGAKSRQVLQAGEELYNNLQDVLPPLEVKPIEEWPAVGYVQLELNQDCVAKIEAASAEDRQAVARDSITQSCIIREGDYVAAQIIGMADLRDGLTFHLAVEAWRESSGGTSDAWVQEAMRQVAMAACWRFPGIQWTLMRGADKNWYAPMIHWVRRIPSQGVMQFDLHFLPMPPTGIPPVETT